MPFPLPLVPALAGSFILTGLYVYTGYVRKQRTGFWFPRSPDLSLPEVSGDRSPEKKYVLLARLVLMGVLDVNSVDDGLELTRNREKRDLLSDREKRDLSKLFEGEETLLLHTRGSGNPEGPYAGPLLVLLRRFQSSYQLFTVPGVIVGSVLSGFTLFVTAWMAGSGGMMAGMAALYMALIPCLFWLFLPNFGRAKLLGRMLLKEGGDRLRSQYYIFYGGFWAEVILLCLVPLGFLVYVFGTEGMEVPAVLVGILGLLQMLGTLLAGDFRNV